MKISIFATVGTTSFDDFVKSLYSLQFLTAMANHDYWASSHRGLFGDNNPTLDFTIQYGRGQCPISYIPSCLLDKCTPQPPVDMDEGIIILSIPIKSSVPTKQTLHRVQLRYFRFKPSLTDDMDRADIIICHAGAGTLLEALSLTSPSERKSSSNQKIINAVINSKLMDNHQSELADELEMRGHISVTRNCESIWTNEDGAKAFWEMIGTFEPVPFFGGRSNGDDEGGRGVNGHASSFQHILDQVMSGDKTSWKRDDSMKKKR